MKHGRAPRRTAPVSRNMCLAEPKLHTKKTKEGGTGGEEGGHDRKNRNQGSEDCHLTRRATVEWVRGGDRSWQPGSKENGETTKTGAVRLWGGIGRTKVFQKHFLLRTKEVTRGKTLPRGEGRNGKFGTCPLRKQKAREEFKGVGAKGQKTAEKNEKKTLLGSYNGGKGNGNHPAKGQKLSRPPEMGGPRPDSMFDEDRERSKTPPARKKPKKRSSGQGCAEKQGRLGRW